MEQFDLVEALRRQNAGIARVVDNNQEFLNEARACAEMIAITNGEVTADDLRKAMDIRPKHPNAWGGVFRGSLWEWTGRYKRSEMVQRHGALQRVWKLKREIA